MSYAASGARPRVSLRARRNRRADPEVVFRQGPEVMHAIVSAAAAIAMADGTATSDERRALLAFLREQGILSRAGRKDVADAFDRAVDGKAAFSAATTAGAAEAIARVAHRRSAWLAVVAARRVATADGIVWPQEAAILAILRDQLDPQQRLLSSMDASQGH